MPKRPLSNFVTQEQYIYDTRVLSAERQALTTALRESYPHGLSEILYDIILQRPLKTDLPVPKVLHAFSLRQLVRLCNLLLPILVKSSDVTKRLRAMRVYPYVSAASHDKRCRFYVDGIQTQCYVLSREFLNEGDMLNYIKELSTKWPSLGEQRG